MDLDIRQYRLSKINEKIERCEDNFACSEENNKYAISDGVSMSFFSGIWSQILVDGYINDNDFEKNLINYQKRWQKQVVERVSVPDTPWFTKNKFIKNDPGLATFVGLEIFKETWQAIAIGDSFLFYVPEYQTSLSDLTIISSLKEPYSFTNYPNYLSSVGETHFGDMERYVSNELNNGCFYLMTDAIAKWFLSDYKSAIKELHDINSIADFKELIAKLRSMDEIDDDDTSCIIIRLKK